jgi:hypothetical protein
MKNKRFTFSVLAITLILLVTTIVPTQAWASARQVEPPDQGIAAAASGGSPIGGLFIIGDLGDQGVDAIESAVAYNTQRQEYLVVWWNDRPGCDDIYGRRVSANGALIGSRFFITAGCPDERRYPDVTYNAQHNEYLVVWEQYDGSYYSIRGRIVSETGGLTGGEITISSGSALKNCYTPAVAYASTSDKYLVVWERQVVANISRDIEAQVLTGTGALDGTNYLLAQGTWSYSYGSPDLSYNHRSNGYLVVWEQLDKSANRRDIYGHLVHGSGTPTGADIEIYKETTHQSNPAVAALPIAPSGQYLVVWEYGTSSRAICSRVVASDGTPAISIYVSGDILDEGNPAVAGNESTQQFLAIWTRYSGPPIITSDLVSWDVSAAGNWSDFGGVSGLFADHSAMAAGKGGDFLVTFDDLTSAGKRGVWGVLWGNRTYIYLPLVVK